MNNWDALIRLIVPLSFMAIWALTSLFNREGKGNPGAVGRPTPPRPNSGGMGEPTLRWGTPSSAAGRPPAGSATPARRPPPRGDDGILILSSDNNRDGGRTFAPSGSKRPAKGKPVVPARKAEPPPTRARLAGVSQNVNQHLTNTTIDMVPLAALPANAAPLSLGLSSAPSAAREASSGPPRSATALALNDPRKLREAFLLNEILAPPVALRGRRVGPNRPD